MDKQTVGEFLARFDSYRRVPHSDSVLIHLGLDYGFVEFKEEFVLKLKLALKTKLMMAEMQIDDLSPIDIFAIELLKNSY